MKSFDRIRASSAGLVLLLMAALLGGCMVSRVATVSAPGASSFAPADKVAVVYVPAPAGAGYTNAAAGAAMRDLGRFLPLLRVRLPVLAKDRGLDVRFTDEDSPSTVRLQPGEALMVLRLSNASLSSRSGRHLMLEATMFRSTDMRPAWKGEIHIGSMGLGSVEQDFADDVVRKLLDRLQADRALRAERVLENCNRRATAGCKLYADGAVVAWKERS